MLTHWVVIPVEYSTNTTNGKNIISRVSDKVRSLRDKAMNFLAPRAEFAMATA